MDPKKIDIEYKGPHDHSPEVRITAMNMTYRDTISKILDNIPEKRGQTVQVNLHVVTYYIGN